jgi:5-(carboxyamino)imidazole ribonucleotide synthase
VSRRIGILGGGQLGLMLSESLMRFGVEIAVYDPDAQAPLCKHATSVFNGAWSDEEKLSAFFEECDRLTYEFENVESELLFRLEKKKDLMPGASVLRITQHRGLEKGFLSAQKLPHVQFAILNKEDAENARTAIVDFGLPCLAKTTFGGYDGKGQYMLTSESDVQELVDSNALTKVQHVLEEAIDIAIEVSCIVARSRNGEEVAFPIFENQHHDHILDLTLVPARIPHSVASEIESIARTAARDLNVFGLLTVEFFLSRKKPRSAAAREVDGWYIMINEFAPRPHNSGHVTMKACDLSQFDMLARILLDVPLKKPQLVSDQVFCMGNLLGDVWIAQGKQELDLSTLNDFPDVIDVVSYGKKDARSKRKMGHFVCRAETHNKAIDTAHKFRNSLKTKQYLHSKL